MRPCRPKPCLVNTLPVKDCGVRPRCLIGKVGVIMSVSKHRRTFSRLGRAPISPLKQWPDSSPPLHKSFRKQRGRDMHAYYSVCHRSLREWVALPLRTQHSQEPGMVRWRVHACSMLPLSQDLISALPCFDSFLPGKLRSMSSLGCYRT